MYFYKGQGIQGNSISPKTWLLGNWKAPSGRNQQLRNLRIDLPPHNGRSRSIIPEPASPPSPPANWRKGPPVKMEHDEFIKLYKEVKREVSSEKHVRYLYQLYLGLQDVLPVQEVREFIKNNTLSRKPTGGEGSHVQPEEFSKAQWEINMQKMTDKRAHHWRSKGGCVKPTRPRLVTRYHDVLHFPDFEKVFRELENRLREKGERKVYMYNDRKLEKLHQRLMTKLNSENFRVKDVEWWITKKLETRVTRVTRRRLNS